MALIDIPVFFLGGGAGGALVWYYKVQLQTFWSGAEATAVKLKADLAAIEAKIASVKAAVK